MESRKQIIEALATRLQAEPQILAFVEGGSRAFKRHDKYSDIDLYVYVQSVDDAPSIFLAVEEALAGLGGVLEEYVQPWPPAAKLQQKFYRLKECSPFLLVDLAVIAQDAPELFIEPEVHGNSVVIFDRTGFTANRHADRENVDSVIEKERARLKARYKMFSIFFDKELLRKRYIQAIDFYYNFILATLVTLLRMQHSPFQYSFRLAGIYRDLPPEVIKKLEPLFFVNDLETLGVNAHIADKWVCDLLNQ